MNPSTQTDSFSARNRPWNISDEELKVVLKRVVWDYNISQDDLLAIFKGEMEGNAVTCIQLKAKLLNGYQWHHLLEWFGYDTVSSFLTDEVLRQIFPKSYQKKLVSAKRILQV